MTIACLSAAECQQQVLTAYHQHVEWLEGWIKTLIDQATAMLESGGSCVGATRLMTTAMRLSREQLNATMRLARHHFLNDKQATKESVNPCAPEVKAEPTAASQSACEATAKSCETASCDELEKAAASVAHERFTPVRAVESLLSARCNTSPLREPGNGFGESPSRRERQ